MTTPITTRKPEKTNGITDGHNSVSKSIGVYRRPQSVGETVSIYRQKYSDGVYSLSRKMQRRGDVRQFYRRNDRGIQTEIVVQ